jgi:hypothetical protein
MEEGREKEEEELWRNSNAKNAVIIAITVKIANSCPWEGKKDTGS